MASRWIKASRYVKALKTAPNSSVDQRSCKPDARVALKLISPSRGRVSQYLGRSNWFTYW